MIGNLQAYMGPEALNAYAVWLRELLHGAGLWIARAVLLLSVILHIWSATALTIDNRRARPVGYRRRKYDRSTYASRTMVWSGPILLLFIIYHLLHFTFGTVHPSFVEGDVYHNFVAGFQVVPVSIFYIVAMLALGYHLYHGIWSMLQTLGLSHPRYNFLRHGFAGLMTAIVVVGNISFPLAVLTGVIR
jgi:succinate dehydrogenase / fumarate reductase cytochrome b subunit